MIEAIDLIAGLGGLTQAAMDADVKVVYSARAICANTLKKW